MASTRNNCITRNSSGKIGNMVLTHDGYMRSRPDHSKRVLSTLQQAHCNRFEEALAYARMAISDPVLNEFYAQKATRKHGLGAWHLAINDYCNPPEVFSAEFRKFNGTSGNEIYIAAYDKYKVTGIMVSFTSPGGMIIEEGTADQHKFEYRWVYTLKSDIELVSGLSVAISAKDLPGNITRVSLVWPFECDKEISFPFTHMPGVGKNRQKSQLRIRNG